MSICPVSSGKFDKAMIKINSAFSTIRLKLFKYVYTSSSHGNFDKAMMRFKRLSSNIQLFKLVQECLSAQFHVASLTKQ
jgi:hypothetical protein